MIKNPTFLRATAPLAALLALGASALGLRADYASTVLAKKPVGYWRLNETVQPPAADVAANLGSLGAAAQGYYLGASAHPVPGALVGSSDTAVSFDATSGTVVAAPYLTEMNPSGAFTAEAWLAPGVEHPAGSGTLTCALSCGHFASPRSGWLIYQSETGWNLRTYAQAGTATSLSISASVLPVAGTWYHIVATYDGSVANLYVNGVLQASGSPTGYVPGTDGSLFVGGRSDSAFFWSGSADEVAFYGKALTAGEVSSHYQNGVSASPAKAYNALVAESAPLAYYRLGEAAYTAPTDLPTSPNLGTAGAAGDATYYPGLQAGAAGPKQPTYSGFGTDNRAGGFNGVAGYVGTQLSLSELPQFTVMGWLKRGTAKSGRGGYFGQNNLLEFGDANSGASIEAWIDAYGANIVVPYPFADNEWGFITLTGDGTKAVLYTNGVAAATLDGVVTSYGSSAFNFNIGGGGIFNDTGDYFLGNVDEVAVFETALSAQEVQDIFNSSDVVPSIVSQPTAPAGAVYAGSSVTLSVGAIGTPTLTYQWRKGGNNLPGKTGAELVLGTLTVDDTGEYDVIVGNGFGSTTSAKVTLTVQPANPPVITRDPVSLIRFVGGKVTFSVDVTGTPPFTYQWQLNEADLPGQTGATLTLNSVKATDAGNYRVVVKNPISTTGVPSGAGHLTVVTPSGYNTAVLADSPSGYWRLGEASGTVANDALGADDGVYTGVALGAKGFSVIDSDTAADFSAGGTSAVALTDSKPYDFNGATPSFTLETWAKFSSLSGVQRIFSNGQPGVSGIGFGVNGADKVRFTTYGVQDQDSDVISPALVVGKWYHLVCVVDAGNTTYYVNGQQVGASIAWSAPGKSSSLAFQFGRNPYAATPESVSGTLDEIAIYPTALSSDRVAAHFNARYGNNTAPVFTLEPKEVTVYVGRPATFSAVADGTEPITYQWKIDNSAVAGETAESMTVTKTTAGVYSVTCTATGAGSTTTTPVNLTVLAVPTVANVSQDLVVHLKFDADYKDVSGHTNNGTAKGKPNLVTGKIGAKALRYYSDATAKAYNYVTLGTPSDLNFGTNVNFSVAFWIKFTGTPGDLPFLANNDNSMGDPGVTIAPSYGEGGWSWGLNDVVAPKAWPGIGLYDPVKNTLNDGVWHHLAHTFNRAGNATTYIDGVQVHQQSLIPATGWQLNTGKPWNIGQASGTYGETGDFQIDDLGIWRRELGSLEVDTIYMVGNTFGAPLAPDVVSTVTIGFSRSGANLVLTYAAGTLQQADAVTGPWSTVTGAASPLTVAPDQAARFYRVKVQ